MKLQIAPSILGLNHTDMRPAVKSMIRGGAEVIHVDVMDGQFVPPITFGDGIVRGLKDLGPGVLWEAHLMTLTPERHFEAFIDAGCKRIIFHVEATNHSHRVAGSLRERGIEAGIAINPGTPASAIKEVLAVVDEVLVMTVNPGWGGQRFIQSALDKVREIRNWSATVNIEVDGGIDPTSLPLARDAGANIFVVGNYLVRQPDIEASMRELNALCA